RQRRRVLLDEATPLLLLDRQGRAGVLVLKRRLEVLTRLVRRVRANEPDADVAGLGRLAVVVVAARVAVALGSTGEGKSCCRAYCEKSQFLPHLGSFRRCGGDSTVVTPLVLELGRSTASPQPV